LFACFAAVAMRVEIIFSLIALIQKLSGVLFCSRVELIGTQVDGIMSPSGLKTFCKRDFSRSGTINFSKFAKF